MKQGHLQGFVFLLHYLHLPLFVCVTIASHIDFMNLYFLLTSRASTSSYKITLTTSFNVCTGTGVQLALCDFWLTSYLTSMSSVLENWPVASNGHINAWSIIYLSISQVFAGYPVWNVVPDSFLIPRSGSGRNCQRYHYHVVWNLLCFLYSC